MPPVVINTSSLPPQVPQWRWRNLPREKGHRGRPSYEKQYKWDRCTEINYQFTTRRNLRFNLIFDPLWIGVLRIHSNSFQRSSSVFTEIRSNLSRPRPRSRASPTIWRSQTTRGSGGGGNALDQVDLYLICSTSLQSEGRFPVVKWTWHLIYLAFFTDSKCLKERGKSSAKM